MNDELIHRLRWYHPDSQISRMRDIMREAADALERSDVGTVRTEALETADRVRLMLSNRYRERVNAGTSEMGGNMDWARLEGAVAVVQALRALHPLPVHQQNVSGSHQPNGKGCVDER